jgi:hypothetical protein
MLIRWLVMIMLLQMLSGEILYLFLLGRIFTGTSMVFQILDSLCFHFGCYY